MNPPDDRSRDRREVIVGQVADEFTERLSRGERPDVEEYVRRHPELGEELRGVLAALLALRRPAGPSFPAGATVDELPALPDSSAAQPDRATPPVLVVAPSIAKPLYLEIQTLLQQRLRILTLIALGQWLLFYGLRFFRLTMDADTIWTSMVPGGVFLALMAVSAGIIWRKRLYSVPQLRLFEAVFFGLVVVFFAWEQYRPLFLPPNNWFSLYATRGPVEISILARQPSIFWLVLIVAYGTFIPNTGRRCAVVTSLMALTPLTIAAVGGFTSAEIPPRLVVIFLVEMFTWMAVAVAMAIYGSHKISVLRQEALEARKLGPYQLKRRLGTGGMGEVYLAEHVLLRRPCAVKLIRPERLGDPSILRRFLREVQVTATLTHPNTVQVFDYGQTEDGTLYYAMEYLSGLSLDELVVRGGPLPPARVVFLLRQLCGALAEAHAVGLIHRDIKPGNVILGHRGGQADVAKLLDFGLVHRPSEAGDESRLTQPGLIFGTPAYVSPEQAAARADVDARSDIYSVGALAYFLLTGQPPFVRASIVQTLAAHIGEPLTPSPRFRDAVPADVQAVVLRCLAKAPDARFADARALDEALANCACAREWTAAEAVAWWETQPPAGSTTI
jgi:eukaryotic-like serine/threonine-protein kinase